jgi:hypothetical protein
MTARGASRPAKGARSVARFFLGLQSTTRLFRPPTDQPLTPTGEWLEMALRLLGPLFFGLTLLALRGRVKR